MRRFQPHSFTLALVLAMMSIVYTGCISSDKNIHNETIPQGAFNDRSQVTMGDYVYDDGRFFSHSRIPDKMPYGLVIDNSINPQVITLQPVAKCNMDEIEEYVRQFGYSHRLVKVPTLDQWEDISEYIYRLDKTKTGDQVCPFLYNGIGTCHYYREIRYRISPNQMKKDFRGSLDAWCADTEYIRDIYDQTKHKHQHLFSPGYGNTNGCTQDKSLTADLYLLYSL